MMGLVVAVLAIMNLWVDTTELNRQEILCLAQTVYEESRGEPSRGQMMVAEVILNRVDHPNYPDTICGVVNQPGQFDPITRAKHRRKKLERGEFIFAVEMSTLMVLGVIERRHPDLLFYFNPEKANPSWAAHMRQHGVVGRHLFLTLR